MSICHWTGGKTSAANTVRAPQGSSRPLQDKIDIAGPTRILHISARSFCEDVAGQRPFFFLLATRHDMTAVGRQVPSPDHLFAHARSCTVSACAPFARGQQRLSLSATQGFAPGLSLMQLSLQGVLWQTTRRAGPAGNWFALQNACLCTRYWGDQMGSDSLILSAVRSGSCCTP